MSKESDLQWNMHKTLEEISGKLDTLISLIKLGQKRELTSLKEQILGSSKVRREIYRLCDGEKTLNEISKIANQKLPNISREISYLEATGLITVKRIGQNKYPQRNIL